MIILSNISHYSIGIDKNPKKKKLIETLEKKIHQKIQHALLTVFKNIYLMFVHSNRKVKHSIPYH